MSAFSGSRRSSALSSLDSEGRVVFGRGRRRGDSVKSLPCFEIQSCIEPLIVLRKSLIVAGSSVLQ